MRLIRFLQTAWWVCTFLTVCIVVSSEVVGIEAGLTAFAFIGWCLWVQFDWKHRDWIPRPWMLWLVFLLFAAIGWQSYVRSKDIVYVVVWLLSGVAIVASRQILTEKGHWRFFLIMGLLSLVSLIASESFLSYFCFILLAPTLLVLLNAAHLYFHLRKNGGVDERISPRYIGHLMGSIVSGLFVGAAIFFLFPRSLQWQNPLSLRAKDAVSGYNGKIDLGAANLGLSSALAAVVESNEPGLLAIEGPNLYFRANALDHFDGKSWRQGREEYNGFISSRSIRYTRAFSDRVHTIKIYRELHTTRAILYPGVLQSISLPRQLQMQLRVDNNGNLERRSQDSVRYAYSLTYSPWDFSSQDLDVPLEDYAAITHDRKGRLARYLAPYLQVPDSVGEAPWFRKFLDTFPKDSTEGAASWVRAVQGRFRNTFRAGYKGQTEGTFDLESFLTQTRYGHCEYFASAATMLLRARGIPARVVLGYRGGVFNPVSNVLEVRDSQAHAWAEYYVPDVGWIPFEPTPLLPRVGSPGMFQEVGQWYGALKFWFERYIVDYNMDTQRSLLATFDTNAPKKTDAPTRSGRWWWVGIGLLCVVGVGFAVRRAIRRHRRLPSYWRTFEKGSVRRGAKPREPSETFLLFCRRVEGLWAPGVAKYTYERLERELYGGRFVG